MKISIIILIAAVFSFGSYTVEKSSIRVGYCNGGYLESGPLNQTINNLGFLSYNSMTNQASDFVTHGCQLVFSFPTGDAVIGWNSEMMNNGRGYIQNGPSGWQLFSCGAQSGTGSTVSLRDVDVDHELCSFPNQIEESWTGSYGYFAYTLDYDAFDNVIDSYVDLATLYNSVQEMPRALSVVNNGAGRGVYYGWCAYGFRQTTNDTRLTENAIIYAAQPPHADAGGPYVGSPGSPLTLDASDSTDNGTIIKYEWDIDNDGTYELTVTTPTTTYTWSTMYSGLVKVRCTDNLSCKSTSTANANIGSPDVNSTTFGHIKAGFLLSE